MASKQLDHRLAFQAFSMAINAVAAGHRDRYLHIGHALTASDQAWGKESGAAHRFEVMIDGGEGMHVASMFDALVVLRDEHDKASTEAL